MVSESTNSNLYASRMHISSQTRPAFSSSSNWSSRLLKKARWNNIGNHGYVATQITAVKIEVVEINAVAIVLDLNMMCTVQTCIIYYTYANNI